MESGFFALLARGRYIRRWGLMRSTNEENISEHSYMTALLAHALAVIRRDVFGGEADPDRCAAVAHFHDASEIITGDLPTPVKYANPEILDAYKREAKGKQPKLLFSHIPYYAPGFGVTYGCGNPDWNEAHDRGFRAERRPKWPADGPSAVTYEMWRTVGKACRQHRVLATFAGHIHSLSSSVVDGWPQFVTPANAEGGYYEVTVEPMP